MIGNKKHWEGFTFNCIPTVSFYIIDVSWCFRKSHFCEIDAVWLATLNTPSLLFSLSLLMASFRTTNLGIAWDSVLPLMLCWLLLNVSWILLFLLVPALKTRLSSFIGGPASGLCLPVYCPYCCLNHFCDLMVCKLNSSAHHHLFLLHCSLCARLLLAPSFVHPVNWGWHNLLFLLYLEALWLILPDLDLVSALQWALSWPSGRVSCFTFSVPIM